MICDIHAHYIPQKFSDFMGDRFGPRVAVPIRTGIALLGLSRAVTDKILHHNAQQLFGLAR